MARYIDRAFNYEPSSLDEEPGYRSAASRQLHVIHFDSLIKETDAAYFIRADVVEAWLPKSKCTLITPEDFIEGGEIEAPAWLLDEKGINY